MKKNMLLLLILILAAASAVFCGTCHAEGEDECKITVEGGYASEPTSYGNVDYCWDLPKDQRIVSVTLRKKTYKSTYREETRAWNAIAYKGETPDGRITWQSRDVISDDVTECTVTAVIETRPTMSPIVFDLQKGACVAPQNEPEGLLYEWTHYSLSQLLANSGLKHNDRVFPYTSYDLDGDGTWDVALSSTGYFSNNYGETAYICKGLLIPLPGRSVSGSTTVSLKLNPNRFLDWYYQYGDAVPVTFLFGEAETRPEYTITVSGGYAESSNEDRTVFTKVIKAAPGTPIRLTGDVHEGEYVSSWTGDYWSFLSQTECREYAGTWFYMPAADVTMTAVCKKQQPCAISLSGGYFRSDANAMINGRSVWLSMTDSFGLDPETTYRTADVDGNGTPDIAIANFNASSEVLYGESPFYIVPLGTCSITDEYTVTALNRGPYWPITFRFAKEPPAQEYKLTVRGGYAQNRHNETVSQTVAPGTPLKVVYDNYDDTYYYNSYFHDDKNYLYPEGSPEEKHLTVPGEDYGQPFTANFVMPAFDITLTFADWDGEDDPPSVTPMPDEITPAPTEPALSPTPTDVPTVTTEATPSPLPADAVTPEADTMAADRTDSDQKNGNLLLWLLIPCAAVLTGLGAFALWKTRKKTHNELGGSYDSEAENADQ